MKKVLLIGCPGSGKTTFSKALSEKTGLPVVHLDRLYHRDNWTTISKEEADKPIQIELEKSKWIMDGNFNRTISHRLKYCDTVFYFELPAVVCLWSVFKRTVLNYGKVREDVGNNCPERFNKKTVRFYKEITRFNKQHKKKYREMLKNAENTEVIIFKTRKQVNEYFKNID